MDHQVSFQGKTCCLAAGNVASRQLPAVGYLRPSYLRWPPLPGSMSSPGQPASSDWAKQATLLQSSSAGCSKLCQAWITAGLLPQPNFFPLPFTMNILHPKLWSHCPLSENVICSVPFPCTFSLALFTTNLKKMLCVLIFLHHHDT